MLKSSKPIIVVSGDPKSIFLEIFFKSFKKSKRPLILLVNKKVLFNQIKILKFRVNLNEIYKKDVCKKKLSNYKINFIDIPLVKNNTRKYIEKSFALALDLLKENNGFYESNIRGIKKVYSTEEIYKERKCNIENGAGYGIRPCYSDINDPNTLEWWLIYYEN